MGTKGAMAVKMSADEQRWQLEEDVRAWTRAAEIKRDKKRLDKVLEQLREKAKAAKDAVAMAATEGSED